MLKKRLLHFFSQLFHAKRVLVVTDKGVNYYPLGKASQWLFFVGVIGFVSWASYSTGSFMAAETRIQEKDRKLREINLVNQQMETQFSLIRDDILKMQADDKKELSEYTRFIVNQYASDSLAGVKRLAYNESADSEDQGMLLNRLHYLEGRVDQLKQQNHELVEAVRDETQSKIAEFEGIINGTGLSAASLERRKTREEEKQAKANGEKKAAGQGGPYIPGALSDLTGIEHLFSTIDRMMSLYDIVDTLPLSKPLNDYGITSRFGRRVDPFNGRMAMHTGVDLMASARSRVVASNDGVVSETGWDGAYGNKVDLEHGLGLATRYAHLSRILVREGQKVTKGEVIGIQGSTGRSTGQHLHYEVRYNGIPLNPVKFLKTGSRMEN